MGKARGVKRSSFNRKPRKRTPADPHWNAARGSVCVGCGGVCGPLDQHHVTYAQEVKRRGGALWDPRNAITLGRSCHDNHHAHSHPIPLAYLPDAALEFAWELMGPAMFSFLGRHYSGDDSRLFDVDGNPLLSRWADSHVEVEPLVRSEEEAPAPQSGTARGMATGGENSRASGT